MQEGSSRLRYLGEHFAASFAYQEGRLPCSFKKPRSYCAQATLARCNPPNCEWTPDSQVSQLVWPRSVDDPSAIFRYPLSIAACLRRG